jgi:hypothetical protein
LDTAASSRASLSFSLSPLSYLTLGYKYSWKGHRLDWQPYTNTGDDTPKGLCVCACVRPGWKTHTELYTSLPALTGSQHHQWQMP